MKGTDVWYRDPGDWMVIQLAEHMLTLLFDMREYDVEFTDGTHEWYQANVTAKNMYAQVDDEGNEYLLLSEIADHKSDGSAIQIADGMARSANGQEKPKVITRGWHLLVQWKDGMVH